MPHFDPSFAEKPPENHPFCAHFRALDLGQIALGQLVATVNRPVSDRGLFPSTKPHGQEGADRGYQLPDGEYTRPKASLPENPFGRSQTP